jgi:hypothetical protein
MRNFSKEEYLALVRQLTEDQYDELGDEDPQEIEWIPAVPEIKEKIMKLRSDAVTDLTKLKKSQLMDSLFKTNNLKVHGFTIKIARYHGDPDQKGGELTVDFTLYHEVYETPNMKAPCRMTLPCNIHKDTRFLGRSWLKHFDAATGSHATKVSTETLIDIVRWIQVAVKYPAFL